VELNFLRVNPSGCACLCIASEISAKLFAPKKAAAQLYSEQARGNAAPLLEKKFPANRSTDFLFRR
jgi:hypothetical protein